MLLLPGQGGMSLGREHREKLRKFVDGGGVLWIDNQGVGADVGQFALGFEFFIKDLRIRERRCLLPRACRQRWPHTPWWTDLPPHLG